MEIDVKLIQLVKKETAIHYRVIPFEWKGNILALYHDNTSTISYGTKEELELITSQQLTFVPIDKSEIDKLLSIYYYGNATPSEKQQNRHVEEDFLDEVIKQALQINSSDIHIETYENIARVRFRIDGVLVERYNLSLEEYPKIINRVKVKSDLDIAEKRLPQDGRIKYNLSGHDIDIRISVLPTHFGEKMVLRLLKNDAVSYEIEKLCMNEKEQKIFLGAIAKPNGIILISGPTGSGKTTTLYALLKILNQKTKNILTIENPVEYTISGVNQVQINEEIGLTFSSTLRTFLRQDPDIIMVGEIRDKETAEMAIRASLTGHLVLSTIHTNSAIGTISRLVDMGIPPYLISETLHLSVSQRLIRKLCSHCKEPFALEQHWSEKFGVLPDVSKTTYKACGCKECYHTGYKGRIAIYEMLKKENLESYFKRERQTDNIDGFEGLRERATQLFLDGVTSFEEILPYWM